MHHSWSGPQKSCEILIFYKINKVGDRGGNDWCWPCTGDSGGV